ncbi:MAG: hypothetical protein E5299_00290 [Burkholderia gladioli]|nr:MAG: hypothetical protein E5299_00290 [Burkholderia gladioli]
MHPDTDIAMRRGGLWLCWKQRKAFASSMVSTVFGYFRPLENTLPMIVSLLIYSQFKITNFE